MSLRTTVLVLTATVESESKFSQLVAEVDEAVAGAGLVKVTLNGKGEMRRLHIDPTLANPDEAEILEDLIVAAHNDAKGKIEARVQAAREQQALGGWKNESNLRELKNSETLYI